MMANGHPRGERSIEANWSNPKRLESGPWGEHGERTHGPNLRAAPQDTRWAIEPSDRMAGARCSTLGANTVVVVQCRFGARGCPLAALRLPGSGTLA